MRRTCKNKKCRIKFTPTNEGQVVHTYQCGIEYAKQLREKKNKELLKSINVKNRKLKEKLKTPSQHKKELQVLVNTFVRIRDTGGNCVSCMRLLSGKFDAGHYYSQGGNPSVRFDLDNIHGQCVHCNRDLHGNLLDYRNGLISRIGQKRVDALEKRRTVPRKYTIPEILNLKRLFKEKIKLIKHSKADAQ